MSIPLDHQIFQTSSIVDNLCQGFFRSHAISYFQYYRAYRDGSVVALVNDTKILKRFIELDFPSFSSYRDCHKMKLSYWILWDEELPWLPVQIGRDLGVHHGITLLRRSKDYFDMIGFGMPEERTNAISYYMNNIKSLENFINSFEKEHKPLINIAEKNRILLPEHNRDTHYEELCLGSENRIIVHGIFGKTHITIQEFSCLRLKLQGFGYKEIANELEISPRSVETYFKRIKERTGYSNTIQFQKMLSYYG